MAHKTFEPILKVAQQRKGGAKALAASMPKAPANAAKLRRLKDQAALSLLSKGVFRAGFNWRVVEKRWPDIEVRTS